MFYRRVFGFPRFGYTNPFNQLELLRRQMDQLSDAFDQGMAGAPPAGVFPLINLTEDQDKYYLKAEIPGVKNDDLNIQADGNSISVSGERKIEAEGDDVKYHRKEREAGKFSRMVSLPGDIDADKIDAQLKHGVLEVVIPKAEAVKPRQITVR